MKTSNGYTFNIKSNVCTLIIPKTQGVYSPEVQKANNEICLNDNLPYFKEIKIKKI